MPKQFLWTRRAALGLGWAAIMAAAALTVQPLVRYLTSKEDRLQTSLVIYNLSLPENSGWQKAAGRRVWVRRDASGVAAIVATCTHLGCEVNYHADKGEWLCPCHASVYDEEGRPVSGPALRPLARAAVDFRADGSLLINTAKQAGMDR